MPPKFRRPSFKDIEFAAGIHYPAFKTLPEIEKQAFAVHPTVPKTSFQRVSIPKRGDWMYEHAGESADSGQSVKSYNRQSFKNYPHGPVETIEVVPVGTFDPLIAPPIHVLKEYLEIFFGCSVRVVKPVNVKVVAVSGLVDGEQLLCGDAFEYLRKRRCPRDVFASVCITMLDLTPGDDWNFVYGQAVMMDGVGVFSFARYSPNFHKGTNNALSEEDHRRMLKKTCRTMAHEVGHIFGLRHCIYFKCIMNGNNGGANESSHFSLCPVCLQKICSFMKENPIDIVGRYKALQRFYSKYIFTRESDWFGVRLEGLLKYSKHSLLKEPAGRGPTHL